MEPFFISQKLRGIPLVSAGQSTNSKLPSRLSGEPITKLNQIEKRQAEGAATTSGILFNRAAMTASTANIINNKKPKTTTTRKPTTTRRASTTTTRKARVPTSTPKPTRTSNRPMLAKLIGESRDETGSTRGELPTKQPTIFNQPPISEIATESSAKVRKIEEIYTSQLTKSTQSSFATLAGNQRRTQQTVALSQQTNRANFRAGYAGQNWVLFNRSDGQLSVFEIMVLASNVLIVSTIILITILSWVKSFKKRKAARTAVKGSPTPISKGLESKKQEPLTEVVTIGQDKQADKSPGDRISKLSMVSSATNPSTTTISETSESIAIKPTGKELKESNLSELAGKQETNGGQAPVKAMAIVQPTENKSATELNNNKTAGRESSLSTSKRALISKMLDINTLKETLETLPDVGQQQEQQQQQQRLPTTISRSVSDLSGSTTNLPTNKPLGSSTSVTDLGPIEPSEMDRRTQLEHLFDGSTAPIIINSDKKNIEEKKANNQADRSDSLESIELPETLMNAIKKYDARGVARAPNQQIVAPSPNVLLGEKETEQVSIALPVPEVAPVEVKSDDLKKPVEILRKQTEEMKEQEKPIVLLTQDQTAKELNEKSEQLEKVQDDKREQKQKKEPPPPPPVQAEQQKLNLSSQERPGNPMGRDSVVSGEKVAPEVGEKNSKTATEQMKKKKNEGKRETSEGGLDQSAGQVRNHQVVINKLEKRKTNLEIVDLRDESVIGKMKNVNSIESGDDLKTDGGAWISMDGVAVVQPAPSPTATSANQINQILSQSSSSQAMPNVGPMMSPSEIIESRFHVDYNGNNSKTKKKLSSSNKSDSIDSKTEENLINNIENELELDNKMRNRKYFVYIVNDGRFTAKKECIARIELPQKRRITLAELRNLIANSQDVALSGLRRSKFKFVTETYRLLTENEDAAILHQVYPTQGVFLKLNIPEQENPVYPYTKYGRTSSSRLSSSGGAGINGSGAGSGSASLNKTTIASRRRMVARRASNGSGADGSLPAIEINYGYDGKRASSVGRTRPQARGPMGQRSKSSVTQGRRTTNNQNFDRVEKLPAISKTTVGRLGAGPPAGRGRTRTSGPSRAQELPSLNDGDSASIVSTLGTAGSNVLVGAKKLFNATFKH